MKNKTSGAGPFKKSEVAISVENLSKVYRLYNRHIDRLKESMHPFGKKYHREFYALKNVNFQVKKGEILGIIGRNGSGKSTFLQIIAGILAQTKGQVQKKGRIAALLELGTGFNPHLSGIENIYLYGTIQGFSEKEMHKKLEAICSFADIGQFIYQPIKIYSSGMKARLAFAVSVNINPDILIVDEVLAVGDELFRRKCYAKMKSFMDKGKTVLLVTHGMNTVNEFCTRAILLDGGELILDAPPKLATIQYDRLLFAKPEDQQAVRNEIIELNRDEKKKQEYVKDQRQPEKSPGMEEKVEPPREVPKEETRSKAFLIPNFISKSRIEYKNYDVEIHDVHMRTLDGTRVNALVTGEEYIYSYRVRFHMDAEEVVLGARFKTIRGLLVSGMNSLKAEKIIPKARKGEEYLMECKFMCNLLAGTYFTNAGVSSHREDKFFYLNRIVDAYAFKVQKNPEDPKIGIANLNQELNIRKLSQG